MKFFIYIFFGIIIGISNVIPGVSGGTVAVILNFYDKLMNILSLDIKKIKANLNFIIPLGIGLVISILFFSKIMKYLLLHYQTESYFCFIGLTLGSILFLIKFNYQKYQSNKHKILLLLPFITAVIIMILFSLIPNASKEVDNSDFSILTAFLCFVSMIIAGATMIMPGISGSLVLVMFGMYSTIFAKAIGSFYIPYLIPAVIGALLGIIYGAKLMRYLLNKYHDFSYSFIIGLLCGSIFGLYNATDFINISFNTQLISLFCLVITTIIIYFLSNFFITRE